MGVHVAVYGDTELVDFVADACGIAEMALKLQFSLSSQEEILKGEVIQFVVIAEVVASCFIASISHFSGIMFTHPFTKH